MNKLVYLEALKNGLNAVWQLEGATRSHPGDRLKGAPATELHGGAERVSDRQADQGTQGPVERWLCHVPPLTSWNAIVGG